MAACVSVAALARACGTDGVAAGIEQLYIIAFKDLAPISGDAGTPIYATASNGMVSNIGLADTKSYVKIDLLKSTSGFKDPMTKNNQNGTLFYTPEMNLVLSDLTIENRNFILSVQNQPVSMLYLNRTGKYFVVGLNGQFELSALEGGTGTAEADLIGSTLTFSGIDTVPMRQVELALVPTLLGE
jgi:hypothetical protein